jgi:hypothetical protein
LKEAWDLSVDVPRWYSQTVDTIDEPDSAVLTVPFDSVSTLVAANAWNRAEYLAPSLVRKLGQRFGAGYVVTGTVKKFEVMKRSAMTDAQVGTSHTLLDRVEGRGEASFMGGLQSYNAKVTMDIEIFSAASGAKALEFTLDSEEKDGGLSLWLPFQTESDEINFHYLGRTPFGSVYFHRSVIGAVMRSFSSGMRKKILGIHSLPAPVSAGAGRCVEGKVLERMGAEVYMNLGQDDRILVGENLEALKPHHAVLGDNGDTLGWAEEPAGLITVRSIKAAHFSAGTIVEEKDSIRAGWTVRSMLR